MTLALCSWGVESACKDDKSFTGSATRVLRLGMNVHISYKLRKTLDLEKEIHQLVEKLRRRLQVFRPELLHLKGTVEQMSPREGAKVSLNLRLPSGQIAVQRSASTPVAAVKASFDDLRQQITR